MRVLVLVFPSVPSGAGNTGNSGIEKNGIKAQHESGGKSNFSSPHDVSAAAVRTLQLQAGPWAYLGELGRLLG
jgi:hypothetical protein